MIGAGLSGGVPFRECRSAFVPHESFNLGGRKRRREKRTEQAQDIGVFFKHAAVVTFFKPPSGRPRTACTSDDSRPARNLLAESTQGRPNLQGRNEGQPSAPRLDTSIRPLLKVAEDQGQSQVFWSPPLDGQQIHSQSDWLTRILRRRVNLTGQHTTWYSLVATTTPDWPARFTPIDQIGLRRGHPKLGSRTATRQSDMKTDREERKRRKGKKEDAVEEEDRTENDGNYGRNSLRSARIVRIVHLSSGDSPESHCNLLSVSVFLRSWGLSPNGVDNSGRVLDQSRRRGLTAGMITDMSEGVGCADPEEESRKDTAVRASVLHLPCIEPN
ncbi:hypothetical protein TYRP_016722 [Tyrophagus putrescentiae]|nr:hypothetical protein TYRP_016722 [Tyrophagus putrescentiae]